MKVFEGVSNDAYLSFPVQEAFIVLPVGRKRVGRPSRGFKPIAHAVKASAGLRAETFKLCLQPLLGTENFLEHLVELFVQVRLQTWKQKALA